MKVSELLLSKELTPVHLPDPDKEIKGAYIGDLLSWVMGRAEANNVWITIMSNVNVLAVATLVDVACVLLCEGVTLEGEALEIAKQKGVNVISSSLPVYETALIVSSGLK